MDLVATQYVDTEAIVRFAHAYCEQVSTTTYIIYDSLVMNYRKYGMHLLRHYYPCNNDINATAAVRQLKRALKDRADLLCSQEESSSGMMLPAHMW